MSTNEMLSATRQHTPRALMLGVALVLLIIVGTVTAAIALPNPGVDGAYDLLITQASINNQNAGYCSSTASQPTCREWCITTVDGFVLPQGQFVCVEE